MATGKESLADQVRHLRTARSWPQEQLADAAGISLRTVQRVERGLPCSADTIQALAAAFEIETAALSELAESFNTDDHRKLGLTGTQAAWVGAIICMPTLAFIAVNIGFYELGWQWLGALRPSGLIGGLWSNPLLLLGAPFLAVMLNVPPMFSLRARTGANGPLIDGILISLRWKQFAIIIFAGVLFGILMTYATLENLQHLIQETVASAASR